MAVGSCQLIVVYHVRWDLRLNSTGGSIVGLANSSLIRARDSSNDSFSVFDMYPVIFFLFLSWKFRSYSAMLYIFRMEWMLGMVPRYLMLFRVGDLPTL